MDKTGNTVLIARSEYDRILRERAQYKQRLGALKQTREEEEGACTRLASLVESFRADLRKEQDKVKDLQTELKEERRRSAKALDVAEEASIAAGMIGRVTLRLNDVLDSVDRGLRQKT